MFAYFSEMDSENASLGFIRNKVEFKSLKLCSHVMSKMGSKATSDGVQTSHLHFQDRDCYLTIRNFILNSDLSKNLLHSVIANSL